MASDPFALKRSGRHQLARRLTRALAVLFALTFFGGPAGVRGHAVQDRPPEPSGGVLLLTSYHQGDAWNDRLVSAFLDALPPGDGPVYVENLDSRRLDADGFAPEFSALLARKYAALPIRLVVACDDAALDFWLARGPDILPGRPLAFCGVNDWNPERIAGRTDVTGVCESPDLLGTLELGLALLPRATTIVALGDDRDPSGRANLNRFRRAMLALGSRARAVELLGCTQEQARKALAALPRDAFVVRLTSLYTDAGLLAPREQSTVDLLQACPVPMLALWDYDFGTGVLCGRLVSAAAQGRAVADLASRILSGQSPASLPVTDAPNQAVVDYRTLVRFGLSPASLPPGVELAHQPPPIHERYHDLIWVGGAVLLVLLSAAVVLGSALLARRAAGKRLRESEARYRELVELAHTLIVRFDRKGELVFVNEYAERLLGHGRTTLSELFARQRSNGPADLSGLMARALLAREETDDAVAEHEITAADGRRVVVRWHSQPLRGPDGALDGALVVGTDITARRRAEDMLAARMLVDEALLAMSRDLLAHGLPALDRALSRLLPAFGLDRSVLMENCLDARLGPCCRLRAEAFGPGLSARRGVPGLDLIPYSVDAFTWSNTLASGEAVRGLVGDFPQGIQEILTAFGVRSVLAVPVRRDGEWWGFLAVGDTRHPREFGAQEQVQLGQAAAILAAALFGPHPAA